MFRYVETVQDTPRCVATAVLHLTILELFLVQVLSLVLNVDQLRNTIWPSHNRIEIAATNG